MRFLYISTLFDMMPLNDEETDCLLGAVGLNVNDYANGDGTNPTLGSLHECGESAVESPTLEARTQCGAVGLAPHKRGSGNLQLRENLGKESPSLFSHTMFVS